MMELSEETIKQLQDLMDKGEDLAKRTSSLVEEAIGKEGHWLRTMVADGTISSALAQYSVHKPEHGPLLMQLCMDKQVLSLVAAMIVTKYNELRAKELVEEAFS